MNEFGCWIFKTFQMAAYYQQNDMTNKKGNE